MLLRNAQLIEALAARRAGVVSRQLLLRAGFDHELPSREISAGRWQKLLTGVYLTTGELPSSHQRNHAAQLFGGRRAVITGGSALRALGVPGPWSTRQAVTLLVPSHVSRVSSQHCRVRRTRSNPTPLLVRREGEVALRVAPRARALADELREATSVDDARAAACAAVRDPELDWDEVAREAATGGRKSGRLHKVVRDLLDGVRSAPEGTLHDLLLREARRGRVPPYLLNPEIYVDGVLLGSPDVWVVGRGLGDEMDSREWHEASNLLDATLLRHERFTRHGLHLNHTTPARFARGEQAHLAKLRRLVAERESMLHPEPPGLVVLGRGPLLPSRTPWPQVPAHRLGLGGFRRRGAA